MEGIMKTTDFEKDLYRWYGEKGESLKNRILRPNEIKYLYWFRRAQSANNLSVRIWSRLMLRNLSSKTNIQIPASTQIGEGFYIGHCGRIVINPDSVLGKNINIATGVTIGQENRGSRKGCPTIADNVWIGTNSVIVGKINIGTDVLIAPLTFVNFDVPAHSIVVGNPAKIINKDNATEDYINRTV